MKEGVAKVTDSQNGVYEQLHASTTRCHYKYFVRTEVLLAYFCHR